MYNVCVLMSTYNGEAYLKEQINSILNQVNVNVHLIIRDDGSSDSTISIIEEYVKNGVLTFYTDDDNLGPACSFMKLLYESGDFDYYAFADQDDIWLKDKLYNGILMIESYNYMPALYCSNQYIYKDEHINGLRFNKDQDLGLVQAICGNVFSGCTMLFNNELASILREENKKPSKEILKIRMHDTWVIAVAQYTGKVIYDTNSYIYYRIHSNNTVGIKKHNGKRFLNKMFNAELRDGRSKLAKELLKFNSIDKNMEFIVKAFANKEKLNLLNKSIICKTNDKFFILKTLLGII